MFRKILLNVAAALVLLIVVMVVVVLLRWDRTFDASLPDVRATTDSAVIAQGRYLVYGPAHCAYCHNTAETGPALDRGEQPPLAGGLAFHLPVGTFRAPNLTPDSQTGIGASATAKSPACCASACCPAAAPPCRSWRRRT